MTLFWGAFARLHRLLAVGNELSNDLIVVHQPGSTLTYAGDREIHVITDRQTGRRIRELGNQLYVWGSAAGPGSLIHADIHAPPDDVRFEWLRSAGSFDLLLDEKLFLDGVVVRYRRVLRPRFFVRALPGT